MSTSAAASPTPVVELVGIGKTYSGVRALHDVSVRIRPGCVHALVGENGAGKSTLGRVIGGIVAPDDGQVLVDGEPVRFRAPHQALARGLAVIQQEPSLVPAMTVRENVFMGTTTSRTGLVDRRGAEARFAELLRAVPFEVDPDAEVGTLSIAKQQQVEILRAISRDARVIVMDEPTSSLGVAETDVLHDVVRHLCAERGTSIVYVSHFLEEILDLAQHFTIMRNGAVVETITSAEASLERLVTGMLGRTLSAGYPERAAPRAGTPVLSMRNVSSDDVSGITFDIAPGEIVGLAGLVGSGRSEVARLAFGADAATAGAIEIDGAPLPKASPTEAIAAGVGFVPEDRNTQGLFPELSQRINVTLAHQGATSRWGVPRPDLENARVTELLGRLQVSPIALDRPVRTLSGGNQQKVLFGRWLLRRPKVLLLDEPTRGVDVGAKFAIYQLIVDLAAEGIGILLISSEAEEVVGLAHRVLVMRRGRIVEEFRDKKIDIDDVMRAALGVPQQASAERHDHA